MTVANPGAVETACDSVRTAMLPDYTGRGPHRGALVRVHEFAGPDRIVRCAGPGLCRECNRERTAAIIAAAKTPAGGYTRATLAAWGVAWPPPKGWKQRLIAGGVLA